MHYFLVRYRLETTDVRATVLTVETGKQMTGRLVSVHTDTHCYWQVSADTRYQYRSNPSAKRWSRGVRSKEFVNADVA